MTQTSATDSLVSSSRQQWTSTALRSPESLKRLRSGSQLLPLHQIDPLIESLDEHEEVELWLNEVINARRAQAPHSALQLRIEKENGSSSSSATWTNLASLEAQLSSLSSTLSFARQDTISAIDSTIVNVKSTIPRLGLELRLMRDAALTLKTNIDELRRRSMQGSDQVNGANASSAYAASAVLERLSALSTLQSRMTSARDVLSLAESWSTLSADVSSYLNDGKYSQASSRLAEAKTSLTVFERTPEYDSRKNLLEGLCNSLVNSVSPSLEAFIKEKNVSESQRIAGILSAIGRADDFSNQWRKGRLSTWLTQWRNARTGEDVEASGTSFAQVLQIHLDSFLVLLNEERLFAPILFPQDPRKSMAVFASTALLALDPSLQTRLKEAIRPDDQGAVVSLVRVHVVIKDAVAAVCRVINRVEGAYEQIEAEASSHNVNVSANNQTSPAISPMNEGKQLGHPVPSPASPNATRPRQMTHSRKISSRQLSVSQTTPKARASSISDVGVEAANRQSATDVLLKLLPEPSEWEAALLGPLIELQMTYASMEKHYLGFEREKEALAAEAALGMAMQDAVPSILLGPQIGKMLREDFRITKTLTEDAIARNMSLTFGLASDELVACVDGTFSTNLKRFGVKLERESGRAVDMSRKQASGRIQGSFDGDQTSSSVEDDQWKAFEESVGLLSSLHQCEQVVEQAEKHIAEQLKDVSEMVLDGSGTVRNDALLRLCGQGTPRGVCKAPLAILIRHYTDRLQAGSLVNTLESALAIDKQGRGGDAEKRHSLLTQARMSLIQQLQLVQQHLADMTLAPLMSYTEVYTLLPIWEALRLPGSVNEYELAMPTFSLSPTEEMSRIGEGLLDLPRLLEVWSDNADLRWAVRGLPHVAQDPLTDVSEAPPLAALSPGSSKRTSYHVSSSSSASPSLDRRPSSHRHSASLAAIATIPANTPSAANGDDSESVLQMYLSSIALSLVSHLISLVLPSIAKLTTAGCSQMAADLEYLLNILSALNVNSTAIAAMTSIGSGDNQAIHLIRTLEAWKDSCKLKDADGRRITGYLRSGQLARGTVSLADVAGFEDDEERLISLAGTPAFTSVTRMRGW